jgi:RNase P subunit RPR2
MAGQRRETGWGETAEEVISGMAEWRVQHPRATLREIEQAVDERLSGLRARLVQEAAMRSAQTDIGVLPAAERPVCRQCGTRLEARGKKTRRVVTSHRREVRLERSYAVCPTCGGGRFPPG